MAQRYASKTMTQDERLFLIERQLDEAIEVLRWAATLADGKGPLTKRQKDKLNGKIGVCADLLTRMVTP